MQIEIDRERCAQMQTLTTLPMTPDHVAYFVDFLLEVGFAAVNEAMLRNPRLTFGELLMIRYRVRDH